ncbi:MAG: beta,4-mannooligosaccharide/beta,4-mannosyl-N-acetylglucosamine phosphorylase [Fusobacteriaceae bacterium]|jgi:beta-1,4-mannooligosaccharide/beta-1,4-mannosyl-N-acetylglucosamine phosphorylase|nr:glycosidase protein [Fusobacteriales bacterium]MDN5303659.1 beta,4-mannooligosaccharide/beta,4-mannosyl-N-acetylglucosamine phosphorylase [Fusobacteriaceae bacterium]
MSKVKIINGQNIPNMPWEDKPKNCSEPVWRYSKNPITDWNPTPSTARIYNSSAVPFGDGFVGVFRADHKNGRAQLHFGKSKDGIHWDIDDEVIKWVDENGNLNLNSYGYDPRVAKIDDIYYITWCDDFKGASVGLGYTKDFKTFIKLPNPFVPYNRNGVMFPRKVNNKYLMMTRPSDSGHTPFGDVFLSESPDTIHWGNHKFVMGKGGQGWWQGTKIGTGPVPIETSEGWLVIYHGVSNTCNGFVYSMGAALLDIDDPSKVLYRTANYLLTPEKEYETTGFVPNVVFPCATLVDAETGRIAIYYGAADTYSALAFSTVDEIIDYMKKYNEVF